MCLQQDGDSEGISVTFFVVVCLVTFKAPGALWLPAALVVSCFGCLRERERERDDHRAKLQRTGLERNI